MNRLWSLLFLAVPVLGIVIVLGASGVGGFVTDRWLPEAIGPRTTSVDGLFNLIHAIAGVVFFLTATILGVSLWCFSADRAGSARFWHGNVVLELLWTAIPAGVLVWLAFYQLPFWNLNKVDAPRMYFDPEQREESLTPPIARVVARQFDWSFVYPGSDGEFDTIDDVVSSGVLVLPRDEMNVLELASEDVIHGFAINALRLKQDIVPGLASRVWFAVSGEGEWEIHCTELCGWGHYRMAAKLRVVSRVEYDQWLRSTLLAQQGHDR